MTEGGERAWSPPTPWFREEPWRRDRKMTPEEVAPFLAELRATVAAGRLPEKRRG